MFNDRIFVGLHGRVLALRTVDGQEIWRQKLATLAGGVIGVRLMGNRLYATCQGEICCLDPATGTILWRNPCKGLGTGYVTLAGDCSEGAAAALDEDCSHGSEMA